VRIFGWSIAVTVVVLAAAWWWGGPEVAAVVAILGVLEVSLSFDNAVVNATVLKRMSHLWQRLFLTVGIVIAVFGMRLLFPVLLVAITAQLSPVEALQLAIENPAAYSQELAEARPAIASFGGIFLLMIFLDFLLQDREHKWITWVERPLSRLGGMESLSVAISLAVLLGTAAYIAVPEDSQTVLIAGCAGLLTYLLVNGLAGFFELEADPTDEEAAGISGPGREAAGAVAATGKAAFFLFMYLELLDASFSFDGVVGAFAITSDIFVIAAGLGIGAFYVRSMTIFLVERGTLSRFVFLEHGAHYAIGALAALLLISIAHEVPELVSGLIGVGFIAVALLSSVLRNRRLAARQEASAAGPAAGSQANTPG